MFGVDVYEATDSQGVPRWMVFRPGKASLIRRINNNINGMCFNKKWVEILYTSNCHYDNITSIDGRQLSRPTIPTTDTHIVIP